MLEASPRFTAFFEISRRITRVETGLLEREGLVIRAAALRR
jgi:hypothetical protein